MTTKRPVCGMTPYTFILGVLSKKGSVSEDELRQLWEKYRGECWRPEDFRIVLHGMVFTGVVIRVGDALRLRMRDHIDRDLASIAARVLSEAGVI